MFIIYKDCLLTVHDAPLSCQDELKLCLSYKPPRHNLSLSVSTVNSQTLKASPTYSANKTEVRINELFYSVN